MKNIIKRLYKAILTYRHNKLNPLRLEFILSDYCNLNCKGCTHFSPIAPRKFISLEQYEKNLKHISAVVNDYIKDFFLIGGEPLLYPELTSIMEITRKYFPEGKISIFTNGLLLPKMSCDFWSAVKKFDIQLAITRYPIKFDYDAVLALCNSLGVIYRVFGDRSLGDSFYRFGLDESKSQNPVISHFKCYNRGCISVTEDKIYPCSISACSIYLNNTFGTNFKHLPKDFIYINELKDIEQIKRLRDKPVPFCRYCVNPPDTVVYSASKRELSEWVNR